MLMSSDKRNYKILAALSCEKKRKKGGKLMIRHASRFDVFLSMLIMLEVSQVNGGMRIIDQGSRLTVYSLRKWCFHVS